MYVGKKKRNVNLTSRIKPVYLWFYNCDCGCSQGNAFPQRDDWPCYFRRSSKTADVINGLRHQNTPSWPLLLLKLNSFIVQDEHGVTFFLSLIKSCEAKLKLLRWNFLPGFQNFSIKKASKWRASTCRCGSTRTHFTHKISPNFVWSHSVTMATAPTEAFSPRQTIARGHVVLR